MAVMADKEGQRHFLFCQHKHYCMGYWNKSAATKPDACVQALGNIPTTNVYYTLLLYKKFSKNFQVWAVFLLLLLLNFLKQE